MTEEVWLPIQGYEGLYEVSNKGRVKSLKRIVSHWRGGVSVQKERILKPSNGGVSGYLRVILCKNSKTKTFTIHQLVAMAFLGHSPCGMKLVVNHINFIKTDNRVENLEIVTQRENANQKHLPSKSKYTGVFWIKRDKKWRSAIGLNGKLKDLGVFNCEIEASKAYQKELNKILNKL